MTEYQKKSDFMRNSGKMHYYSCSYIFFNGLSQSLKVCFTKRSDMWYEGLIYYKDSTADPLGKNTEWQMVSIPIGQYELQFRNSADDNLEPTQFIAVQTIAFWQMCPQYQRGIKGTVAEIKRFKELIKTIPIHLFPRIQIDPVPKYEVVPEIKPVKRRVRRRHSK